MDNELQQFVAVGLLILVAVGIAFSMLILPFLLGKKRTHSAVKDTAYECGMPAITDSNARFSVKFYLIAMLFILLDVEVVFFLGWAAVYRQMLSEIGWRMFAGGAVFLLILEVGHIYCWKKGALDWAPKKDRV